MIRWYLIDVTAFTLFVNVGVSLWPYIFMFKFDMLVQIGFFGVERIATITTLKHLVIAPVITTCYDFILEIYRFWVEMAASTFDAYMLKLNWI